ncbi:hypothetical protein PPMP20_07815 [Paraburkholderia phymatum]|uniref:Uncharacterized protein n=1 Tax=Paraburkholderia phymatum (strain DSM 17167 / CIP 108236 / LMG 21445 / STM815) TaxID=391038 RepID=B2JHR0_PARP8|nr:hypothetical protein [Paraburkholderia phymatum]ACC70402.1 conserved hypothetical protein [Paraburkholderia phymatum STM815]
MSPRFQIFERIAFSLVVMSAVLCSGYIAWETSPDFQDAVHASAAAVRWSGDYSFICASTATNACDQLPVD